LKARPDSAGLQPGRWGASLLIYRQAGLIPKDDFRVRAGDYEKGSSIIAGTGIGTPVRETGGLAACLTNRT